MKSSASAGSLTEQSASLPGSAEFSSARLAREVARLARGRAGLRGGHGLADDRARLLRVLLEELGELGVDDRGDEALHARVAELGLRLALELRVGQLGRDDRGQALADVLAGEVLVLLLELALLARVAVERARQRRAEAGEVRAALVRVDVVGEREHRLLVGGVPLHRDLDRALVALALEEDDLLLDRVLVLVEVARRSPRCRPRSGTRPCGCPRRARRSIVICRPRVRNAVSRRRCSSVAKSKSSVSKISASGRNVIVVPVSFVGSPFCRSALRHAAVVVLRPREAVAPDLDVRAAPTAR